MRLSVLFVAALALAAAAAAAEPTGSRPGPTGPGDQLDGLLGGFAINGQRGPVRIDADTMEFDYKTRILTYRGAVTVTQEDMTLHSNTLRVTLDPEHADKPREVVAEGKVQIDKGARRATGGRAVFDNAARTVTLSEDARLHDGPNEVAGERVVVYLDEQRSVVEGGQERVRAVLYPSDKGGQNGRSTGAAAGDGVAASEPTQ
jgi:lipopolysaccharide export system protein LptA